MKRAAEPLDQTHTSSITRKKGFRPAPSAITRLNPGTPETRRACVSCPASSRKETKAAQQLAFSMLFASDDSFPVAGCMKPKPAARSSVAAAGQTQPSPPTPPRLLVEACTQATIAFTTCTSLTGATVSDSRAPALPLQLSGGPGMQACLSAGSDCSDVSVDDAFLRTLHTVSV